ncbi:MAG TPA: MGMT family protein [Propionibacteriaceae bacterium]|jgi:alkylated DNA nucleotide flippase Atl1
MDEAYVEAVLREVEQIPAGSVRSYGEIAELVGRGGPRQVGHVMSRYGAAVPWWRVVRADGRPVAGLEEQALALLQAEDVPMRGDRIDLRRLRIEPGPQREPDHEQK